MLFRTCNICSVLNFKSEENEEKKRNYGDICECERSSSPQFTLIHNYYFAASSLPTANDEIGAQARGEGERYAVN